MVSIRISQWRHCPQIDKADNERQKVKRCNTMWWLKGSMEFLNVLEHSETSDVDKNTLRYRDNHMNYRRT